MAARLHGTNDQLLPTSVARNTVLALTVQLLTSAFTAALTLVLVRALDAEGFGILALAVSIGLLLLVPIDFGISHAAARFVAEHRGDRAIGAEIVADALRLKFVTSAVVALALFSLSRTIAAAYGEPDLVWPLRAVAISVFFQSVFLFVTTIFVASANIARNLRLTFWESVSETGTTLALVMLGGGAAGAAFGRAAGYAAGAMLAIVVLVRFFGRRVVTASVDRARLWRIGRYSGALALVNSTFAVFAQINVLLLGAIVGSSAVGVFAAPQRLLPLVQLAGESLANGVAPQLARTPGREPNVTAFIIGLRLLLIVQAFLLPLTLVWAEPIIGLLFGAGFEGSVNVLRAYAPYVFLSGFGVLLSVSTNYLGAARVRIPVTLTTLGLNLVLALVLIPRYSATGAAASTSASYAVYVLAHLLICRRLLKVELRLLVPTLLRALTAATAMGIVLAAVGTGEQPIVRFIAGGLAGAVAFGIVLLALGETPPRRLRATLVAVAGRGRRG